MGSVMGLLALFAVILVILFTYLGNGYAIIREKKAAKTNGKSKGSPILAEAVLGGVLVFLTFAAPWIGLVTVFAYGLLALMRGGSLIAWAFKLKKGAGVPPELSGIRGSKLLLFGVLLIAAALLLWAVTVLVSVSSMSDSEYRVRAYVSELKAESKSAYAAATAYIESHPGERIDTPEKLLKAGYSPSSRIEIIWVNVSKSGGEIRLRHRKLKEMDKPFEAVITDINEGPRIIGNTGQTAAS